MAEHYYRVGIHGAPTPETAPHGYRWRAVFTDGSKQEWRPWGVTVKHWDRDFVDSTEWAPLPAPPTEEAPPPEPMAPWSYGRDQVYSMRAVRYRDALNALERDGVAWGPGRPMSELPDDGLVLVQMSSGVPCTFYIRKADYIATHRNTYDCWWPLPGEAPDA
jgi:hypothetical protein